MKLKEYKCPNCGGALKIDTDIQKIECPYCDSKFRWHSSKSSKEKLSVPKTNDDESENTLIPYPYYSFLKMSKKEEREWWVIDHPDTAIPERIQYVANDPDDEKRKFRYWPKAIISIVIFVTLVFVLMIVSILLNEKEIITDEVYTTIMLGAFLAGFISLLFFIINGIFRNGSRLQRMIINTGLSIASILTIVLVLLEEKGIMTYESSTFIRLGFILLSIIGLAFRIINRIAKDKTKKGHFQKSIIEIVGYIGLIIALIYFGLI
jgi:cation transport ATPase